ncbi:hypothetical protein ACE6H2_008585 [Prunus campanulata]
MSLVCSKNIIIIYGILEGNQSRFGNLSKHKPAAAALVDQTSEFMQKPTMRTAGISVKYPLALVD